MNIPQMQGGPRVRGDGPTGPWHSSNAITSQQPQKSCTIWTQSAGPSRCAYRFAARFATIHGFGRRLFSTAVKRPRRGASA